MGPNLKRGNLSEGHDLRASKHDFPAGEARAYRRLEAFHCLAGKTLERVEELLGRRSESWRLSPCEIEEWQRYFLVKLQHARGILREMADLLPTSVELPDNRELISTELMVLFILAENCRPERMLESGWKPDEEMQQSIREKIESLGLDIINMRERLK